jgi:hypothetical protein
MLCPMSAVAQTERQHGAHVHGEATGNLALDGSQLRLELEIPGINLAGFERPPRGPEETATLERVISVLNAGSWLTVDERGDCRVESINAHTHGFDADEQEHSGHDHHDHEQSPHHDHSEFHIVAYAGNAMPPSACAGWMLICSMISLETS